MLPQPALPCSSIERGLLCQECRIVSRKVGLRLTGASRVYSLAKQGAVAQLGAQNGI